MGAAEVWLEAAHAAETASEVLAAEGRKQREGVDQRAYQVAAFEVRALARWFYRRALKANGNDHKTPAVEVLDDPTPVDGSGH